MVPAIRALADRFTYDTATLKYVAAAAPEGGLDRMTEGSGWSVRQVLAHLALNQQRYADTVEQWLRDPRSADPGGDPTDVNARMATETSDLPPERIIAIFDDSIRRLVAATDQVEEPALEQPLGLWNVVDVLASWSRHAGAHARDLVSALPELRTDPMVLNWALFIDFSGRPESAEWQARLLSEVRAIIQAREGDA